MRAFIGLFIVLFLLHACSGKRVENRGVVVDPVFGYELITTDETTSENDVEEEDDSSEIEAHLDAWYQNFPFALKNLKNLIEQKKYQEALSMCESDSIKAIAGLLERSGNPLFFPEFSGLSDASAEKFRENASKEHIRFIQLKIDLYEKEAQDKGDFSSPETYIYLLNQLAYCYYAEDFEKAMNQINKAINFTAKQYGKQHEYYANGIFNKAILYKEMGNKKEALKKFQESKEIYEQIGMKDSQEWENCVEMIENIDTN